MKQYKKKNNETKVVSLRKSVRLTNPNYLKGTEKKPKLATL